MLATGADAVVIALRDGGDSILEGLGLPALGAHRPVGDWEEALALAAIALAGLAGALIGGSLGPRPTARARARRAVTPAGG